MVQRIISTGIPPAFPGIKPHNQTASKAEMTLVTQNFYYTDKDTAERLRRMEQMLGTIMETLKMSFDELKAAQEETDAKVEAVAGDIKTLMDKLAAIPTPGMTPEQEAALADAVAHAKAINDRLGAIDALNP